MSMLRIVLGLVLGVAIGLGLVMAGDMANHALFPPPPDLQITNPDALRAYMAEAPILSLLGLPVTWTVAVFAAAFAGAKVAGRAWVGWVAGGLLFAATLANLALIPHPIWMLAWAVALLPPAAWFAARLGAPSAAAA